jgi:ABC-type phosphate/phosphonate transport system ATPase subunit
MLFKEMERQSKPKKKNPAAVALGRLGGRKGGVARAKKLSPQQRSEIARRAGKAGAAARWGKNKPG